jgi:hypothetical protein
MHTREVRCWGYERDDGLWDIEGRITDVKSYSFENHDRGGINAGEPMHDMWVRLTLDDDLVVQSAEASTDAAPHTMCPEITGGVGKLKGERIAAGWTRTVQAKLGCVLGCTHIVQLLTGPVATTVFQTITPIVGRRRRKKGAASKPNFLGTCHAYAPDSPVVKRMWPDYYTGPD